MKKKGIIALPIVNFIKPFCFLVALCKNELDKFVPNKPFQPVIMFVDKA